jgi:hypothetical protein
MKFLDRIAERVHLPRDEEGARLNKADEVGRDQERRGQDHRLHRVVLGR